MSESRKIEISVAKITKTLGITTAVVLAAGFVANYYIYHVAKHADTKMASLMQRFDLGFEPSIPNFYSALLLLSCAICLCIISSSKFAHAIKWKKYWVLLTLIFFFLSLDEAVMIHEMADAVLQRKLNTTGVLYLAWVIPFGIFAAAVGLIYLRFLMDLERKTAIRFVVAGAIFVGGAIGMEMAAAPIIETVGPSSIYHTFTQTIEEGMEMTGAILFLRALLLYIAQIHDDILVKTSP